MSDLISRQAAIDAMFAGMPGLMFNDVLKILRTLPSAHPEITLESAIDYLHSIGWMQEHDRVLTERKTGRWEKVYGDHIRIGHRPWTVCCSECGMIGGGTRYCPNCGADMRTPTQVQLDEADDVMMMGGDNGKTD